MKEDSTPLAEAQAELPRDQVYVPSVTGVEQSSFKIPVEQLSPDGVELLNRACQDDNLSSSGTIRMQTTAGAILSLAEGVPLQCSFEQDGSYKLTAVAPSDHFDTALKILAPHLQAGRLSWQAQQDDTGHLCLTALLADIGAGGNTASSVHANAVSAIASAVAAAAAAAAGVTSPSDFTRISNLAGSISNITSELAASGDPQVTPPQNLDAAVEDILARPSHLQQFMLQALQQSLGKEMVKGPRTGTKGIKVHVSKVDKRELLPTASTDVPASLVVCDGEGGAELHSVPDTMLESRPRSDDPNMYWYSIRYPRSGAPHINEKTTKWKLDMDSTGRLLVTALIGTYEAPSRSDANTPKPQTYVQQPVRKPPPPPPKLQIYRAQMDKTHKDILDRHLQGIYNHYGATTQILPGAILLKYQATTGEIVGPFPTDVTVIIKKEIRQNRLPGWKYYIPTENLPSHINLEMEKVLWWVVSEEDGHIVLTVYPDRDSAPIAALMDSAQRSAIEAQRARLALPPPHQLVLPATVPGSGQKRPRSPNALSAAQSLRKLARSAPTDGSTEEDEDWGRSNNAIAQRLAAVAGAGPSGATFAGADVLTDVMPTTDVKSAVATRSTHLKAQSSRAMQLPAHLRATFGKPPDLSGGWPSLPHGDSWTEVVQGLLKALRFLGAEKVMIARWWHWVSQHEGVRGWYRRMLLAWQVSQKLNNVDQVQAIFSKRDRELLEQFYDSSGAWGTLPELLDRAKLRPAPVENLLVDNKVSCSDFITEAVYALKAADLVSMEQANDALLPLLMDTVPDAEVVKCAKRMEKFWSAQDVEGMLWAFLCLASEKATA